MTAESSFWGGLAMPLLDHFHPPLSQQRNAESFLGQWLACLHDRLNLGGLPPSHFAEMFLKRNGRVTPDEEMPDTVVLGHLLEFDAFFPAEIELRVTSTTAGPWLVGVIVFVGSRNKSCPEGRRALALRCLSLLQDGIGIILVDIVTKHRGNIHDEMAALLVGESPR
jgi:hypothetical protein